MLAPALSRRRKPPVLPSRCLFDNHCLPAALLSINGLTWNPIERLFIIHPHNLHFSSQLDSTCGLGTLLDRSNQLQDIFCPGPAIVYDKIAVNLGDTRRANGPTFQAQFFDEFAGRALDRIFENAARTGSNWLAGLPLLLRLFKASINFLKSRRASAEGS